MAKPRIFVSSTYYDLKHIRSSLEMFIESLGFEPVLSEKGDISYSPDRALDESCYKEAAAADMFVLVVGGRYGAATSKSDAKDVRKFYEQYESITRKEFETAYEEGIPVFILVEAGVFGEYQTYLRNRSNDTVEYAHVDSINVFRMIESIMQRQKNNPVFQFEKSSEIESWLRDQWSGMFRDLLRNRSQQRQLLALTGQVADLKETNETLKKYLEVVLNQVTPETSKKIISDEEIRIREARQSDERLSNDWYSHLTNYLGYSGEQARKSILLPKDRKTLFDMIDEIENEKEADESKSGGTSAKETLLEADEARKDFNSARRIFGLDPISFAGRSPLKPRKRHQAS